jgi:hypothetical protein
MAPAASFVGGQVQISIASPRKSARQRRLASRDHISRRRPRVVKKFDRWTNL